MQKMKEQLAGGIKPELSDKYKNSYVNYVQLFESNFDKQKPAQVRIGQLKQAWSRSKQATKIEKENFCNIKNLA